MRKIQLIGATVLFLCSCGGLSRQEKEIAGDYFNAQLSDELPVLELNENRKSVVRNIAPDVLLMEVDGTWSIVGDSLIIINNLNTVRLKGDTSIVGNIAPRFSRKITGHDAHSITLSKDNIDYLYIRHHKESNK